MPIRPITSSVEKTMHYVAGRQRGYMKELKQFDKEVVNSLKTVGFLKTGYTTEEETFGATKLFNRYYKICFGETEYIRQRLRSVFENKHKT